ncbi:MAG TPA: DUF2892 domain-containing protein [Spirochaetota bacterium]|nr:DUF2892 domain-containing protein [Spirochaetota bacterium]HPJ36997.1 DUF2892 domain-containing protein [Spirochaetota bacterium]HPQ52635.1 DUF2892 domain-containing protein [Spirochaetota bacterium]
MKKNIGLHDRFVRFILGLAALMNIFALQTGPLVSSLLAVAGIVLLYTSIQGYCSLYDTFGYSTCKDETSCNEEGEIMKQNVGKTDRFIRFILGVAFLLNIFTLNTGVMATVILVVLALSMLYSSITGYCPLYELLKVDTCAKEDTCSEEQSEAASH